MMKHSSRQLTVRQWLVRFFLIASIALAIATWTAAPSSAQGFRVVQPAPDCRIFQRRYDNFTDFSSTGFVQSRIAWHAEMAVLSLATAYLISKAFHWGAWPAAATTAIGLGLVPHVRSVLIQRRYPMNPGDWAFDLWNRAVPAVNAIDDHAPTITLKSVSAKGAAMWLVGYVALACFSDP